MTHIRVVSIMGWELLEIECLEGVWVNTQELSRHLDDRILDRASMIYSQHSDYFVDKIDTLNVNLILKEKPCEIRIFSERGALKLLNFSDNKDSDKIIDELFDVFLAYKNKKQEVPQEAWPLIAQQGRLISLIAEECDKDRKRIDALEEKLSSIGKNEDFPDDNNGGYETISVTQLKILQNLVRDIASGKDGHRTIEMSRVWRALKKHFKIHSYQNILKSQFNEAFNWLSHQASEKKQVGYKSLPLFEGVLEDDEHINMI